MKKLFATMALALGAALPLAGGAQPYPSKPIRMIVPFAPGGPTDVFARLIGQKLNDSWGQPVIVDNRAGATGTIGTGMVAKAAPDGYTLLMASTSSHISAYLYQNQPYDPNKDLEPIINVITLPFYLVAHPALPADNVQALVAEAKRRPGHYAYSSPGAGSGGHLVMELFKSVAGIDLLHVPFKGAAPSMTALVAGQVQLAFDTVSTAQPHVKAGKLKALAVSSARRSSAVPDVPTIKESGYPDFETHIWFALFASGGTPADLAERINAEVTRIMQTKEMQDRMASLGGEFTPQSPAAFGTFVRTDSERWQRVIKMTGARAD